MLLHRRKYATIRRVYGVIGESMQRQGSNVSVGGAGIRSGQSISPFSWLRSAWNNRVLILRLTRREIETRYRGSFLGVLWSLVVPIALLAVYTFVFSVVFEARWQSTINDRGSFALVLFSGLIVFNVFSECLNRAPSLMLQNVSYIKKVVFPLEILPWVTLLAALFNAAVSFGVLFIGYLFLIGTPPVTALLIPVLILPFVFLTLGVSLFLASIGVFIRDLQHVVGVATMMLMFLTPIFFPLSAIPERFRAIIQWSPLSLSVEEIRNVLFFSQLPDPALWTIYTGFSCFVAWLGYAWFVKTKKGFADVV